MPQKTVKAKKKKKKNSKFFRIQDQCTNISCIL